MWLQTYLSHWLRQVRAFYAQRYHCISYSSGSVLRDILDAASHEDSRKYNLSFKYFKNRFGDAVKSDPHLQEGVFEWRRKVAGSTEEVLCCPEDVLRGARCTHDDLTVCSRCQIPICNDCWRLSKNNCKIPKALANDNFNGYAHAYIVAAKVNWLEATIAGPVFSGLVAYYIEGDFGDRHHMMESAVGKAERSWAVRGNIFSFLLPWERILAQLFQKKISSSGRCLRTSFDRLCRCA